MSQINDPMKETAARNIVAYLKTPNGKPVLAQASVILETVQNAFITNDTEKKEQAAFVQFMNRYIKEFATATQMPAIGESILYNNLSLESIVQLLSAIKVECWKESNAKYIAESLDYFINYFKKNEGVKATKIFKSKHLTFTDYPNNDFVREAVREATNVYTSPIFITFADKSTITSFAKESTTIYKDATISKSFTCKHAETAIAQKWQVGEIKGFTESMFPLEFSFTDWGEFIGFMKSFTEAKEIPYKKVAIEPAKEVQLNFKDILIICSVVAVALSFIFIVPKITEAAYLRKVKQAELQLEKERLERQAQAEKALDNTDLESWMVGTWAAFMTSEYGTMTITLEIDKYGNTFEIIEYNGRYERNSFTMYYDRRAEQLYHKDHGGRVSYGVESAYEKIYMSGNSGKTYFSKQ